MPRRTTGARKRTQKRPTHSTGPFTVGLMALHDRAFFERLLTDPRSALTEMVNRGKLALTNADIDKVARVVGVQPRTAVADGMATWDHWQATGQVGNPRVEWMGALGRILAR